jgi:N-acyl-D-aspartate/D-glutamate deacylase
VRDRERGEKLPLEFVVRKQTSAVAELFGLTDRGALLVPPAPRIRGCTFLLLAI